MPISVRSERAASRKLIAPIRALIRTTVQLEGRSVGEISVVLTDDATLRGLNRQWRGIDRATDVLSFGYEESDQGPVSGDLAISLDRLRVQAKRYRLTEARELARLVIHGTLHLCGLDHQRDAERKHMRKRERAVIKAAGRV